MNMQAEQQHVLCTKTVPKLTDISNLTGNFLYLCQRLWSHILTSVLTQLNTGLDLSFWSPVVKIYSFITLCCVNEDENI